jgi:hypothetical protein
MCKSINVQYNYNEVLSSISKIALTLSGTLASFLFKCLLQSPSRVLFGFTN